MAALPPVVADIPTLPPPSAAPSHPAPAFNEPFIADVDVSTSSAPPPLPPPAPAASSSTTTSKARPVSAAAAAAAKAKEAGTAEPPKKKKRKTAAAPSAASTSKANQAAASASASQAAAQMEDDGFNVGYFYQPTPVPHASAGLKKVAATAAQRAAQMQAEQYGQEDDAFVPVGAAGQGVPTVSIGGVLVKVKEGMAKGDAAGEMNGMRYFTDFKTLPFPVIEDYLVRNGCVPAFGQGALPDVWNEDEKVCDPRILFAQRTPTPPPALNPYGLTAPPLQPPYPRAKTGSMSTSRPPGTSRKRGASPPPGTFIEETGQEDGSGRGGKGKDVRRRHTNTSMTAAVIQESIMMAALEEEKRNKEEADRRRAEGLPPLEVIVPASQDPMLFEGGASGSQAMDVDPMAGPAGGSAVVFDESGMDIDQPGVGPSENGHGGGSGDSGDGDNDDDGLQPKTLRRSGRKPAPKGASLAEVHRQTRVSYSPTPSITSSDSEYVPTGFAPIMADLDAAEQIFREKAAANWTEALKVGMMDPNEQKLKLANGGQVPTWNPTMLGMVQLGGTGGLMKEPDIVVDFLYSLKVGNRQLKVAPLPSLSSQMQPPNSAA